MRALMLDPPILLFDEPLAALDPIIRLRLQEDLRRIFRELKKTVLFVTHDLAEAAFVADEIALVHDGALVQKGSLDDLVKRPKDAFVTEFFQAQRVRLPANGEAEVKRASLSRVSRRWPWRCALLLAGRRAAAERR